MNNEFIPISDNFISFCTSNATGVYTIDISHHMMDVESFNEFISEVERSVYEYVNDSYYNAWVKGV